MSNQTTNRCRAAWMGMIVTSGACAWWWGSLTAETLRAQESKPVGRPSAAPSLTVSSARVEDLAWLEGTWLSTDAINTEEERWSAPRGDSLVGTFRSFRRGQVWMYELMSITHDHGRLFLWLKHFTRKLASWEEKDEIVSFALTHIAPNKVVFLNPKYEDVQRVTYYRPVPETLVVRLKGTKDGEPTLREFQFSRVGP